jgi:hypothetical protein
MDFPLITYDPYTGLATVGIPQNPRAVKGVDKLSQIVCIAILKNGGQDVFSPGDGSGLRAMIGQFNHYDPSEIKTEVIQRVKLIEQQIIANQLGYALPATERLVSLRVLSVVVDSVTWNTAVRVQIINEAGQSIVTVV